MTEKNDTPSSTNLAEQFAALWGSPETSPDVFKFLADHEQASATQQADVLFVDQAKRWQQGSGILVEEYFDKCPDIAADETLKLQLIVEEFGHREECGDTPTPEEINKRFPELQDRLLQTLSISPAVVDTVEFAGGSTDEIKPPTKTPANRSSAASKTFGDYELLEEIARGGMGVVYKARQRKLDRVVALKMILSGQLASESDVRRFRVEAEAAAKLDHPNIVPVFDVGAQDGQHYFSMGYVDGGSLQNRLKDGPLPPKEAAELIETICAAVSYAHSRGIVHRDLKPSNVLLDRGGQPRITDFGLAKKADLDSELTATGQILGTPSYMPPEQADGRLDEIGPRSDVYSLGAILYCLLTGRPPFQSANVMDTLQQVRVREPVSPRQLNPAVDRDLETICLKCLEKEPERRYRTANALAEDVKRYLDGQSIHARPLRAPAKLWRWCRRNRLVAGLIAGVVAAVLIGAGTSAGFAVQFYSMAEQRREAAEEATRESARANRSDVESEEANRLFIDTVLRSRMMKEPRFGPLRRELLTQSMALYRKRIGELQASGRDPERVARLIGQLGLISRDTGNLAEARDAFQLLVTILEKSSAAGKDLTRRRALAGALFDLGVVQLMLKENNKSRQTQARANELQSQIVNQTDTAVDHLTLGKIRGLGARLYLATANIDAAAREFDAALSAMNVALKKAPNNSQILHSISLTLNNQFVVFLARRNQTAGKILKQAVSLRKSLSENAPENRELQHSHAKILIQDAMFRNNLESAQRAVAILRPLVNKHPHFREMEFDLARAEDSVAGRRFLKQDYADASEAFGVAIRHLRKLVYANPKVPKYRRQLSMSVHNAAIVELKLNNRTQALNLVNEAVRFHRELLRLTPNDTDAIIGVASSLKSLAQIQSEIPNERAASVQSVNAALSLLQQIPDADSALILTKRAEIHHTLAVITQKTDPKLGIPPLRKALGLQRRAFEKDRTDSRAAQFLNIYLLQTGSLLRELGRYDDAIDIARQRTQIWPKDPGFLYIATVEVAQARKDLREAKTPPANKKVAEESYRKLVLEYLTAAIRAGFADANRIETESAFVPFGQDDDQEFQALYAQIKRRALSKQQPGSNK